MSLRLAVRKPAANRWYSDLETQSIVPLYNSCLLCRSTFYPSIILNKWVKPYKMFSKSKSLNLTVGKGRQSSADQAATLTVKVISLGLLFEIIEHYFIND